MSIFKDERIWRWLTNFWTYAFLLFLVWNFISRGEFEYLIAPLSVVYVGILGLYVGTKEFDRWYDMYEGDMHPGEWFVIMWTVAVFGLLAASFLMNDGRKVSSEGIATYIMVLSVFALTQKSKAMYRRKKSKK